jgi:putative transposase
MRFSNSIFVQLLKPINRRQFTEIVERHDGNAYDKSFKSWEHLVTLLYAQFTCTGGLRGLTESWNASPPSITIIWGPMSGSNAPPCRMPTSAGQ